MSITVDVLTTAFAVPPGVTAGDIRRYCAEAISVDPERCKIYSLSLFNEDDDISDSRSSNVIACRINDSSLSLEWINSVVADCDSLRLQLADTMESLENLATAYQDSIAKTKSAACALQMAVDLKASLEATEAEMDESRERCQNLEQKFLCLQQELMETQKSLHDSEANGNSLQTQLKTVLIDLENQKMTNRAPEASDMSSSMMRSLRERLIQSEKVVAELRSDLASRDSAIKLLESQLAGARKEMAAQARVLNELRSELTSRTVEGKGGNSANSISSSTSSPATTTRSTELSARFGSSRTTPTASPRSPSVTYMQTAASMEENIRRLRSMREEDSPEIPSFLESELNRLREMRRLSSSTNQRKSPRLHLLNQTPTSNVNNITLSSPAIATPNAVSPRNTSSSEPIPNSTSNVLSLALNTEHFTDNNQTPNAVAASPSIGASGLGFSGGLKLNIRGGDCGSSCHCHEERMRDIKQSGQRGRYWPHAGSMYYFGQGGVPVNYAEASKYFHKAAEEGDRDGQFILGCLYERGVGVQKDARLSYLWHSLASNQGDIDASRHRTAVATTLTDSEVDKANMVARHWQPASRRERVSAFTLTGDRSTGSIVRSSTGSTTPSMLSPRVWVSRGTS